MLQSEVRGNAATKADVNFGGERSQPANLPAPLSPRPPPHVNNEAYFDGTAPQASEGREPKQPSPHPASADQWPQLQNGRGPPRYGALAEEGAGAGARAVCLFTLQISARLKCPKEALARLV